jgi:hypothetical protein
VRAGEVSPGGSGQSLLPVSDRAGCSNQSQRTSEKASARRTPSIAATLLRGYPSGQAEAYKETTNQTTHQSPSDTSAITIIAVPMVSGKSVRRGRRSDRSGRISGAHLAGNSDSRRTQSRRSVGDLSDSRFGARTPERACVDVPHTGNQAFVELFDQTVADYPLFNYILDIVPRLPLGLGFMPLPRRTVILPTTAEAAIRVNAGCNHHVICYCATLDYEGTIKVATPAPPGEAGSTVFSVLKPGIPAWPNGSSAILPGLSLCDVCLWANLTHAKLARQVAGSRTWFKAQTR